MRLRASNWLSTYQKRRIFDNFFCSVIVSSDHLETENSLVLLAEFFNQVEKAKANIRDLTRRQYGNFRNEF